jgi:hypothetical protein
MMQQEGILLPDAVEMYERIIDFYIIFGIVAWNRFAL